MQCIKVEKYKNICSIDKNVIEFQFQEVMAMIECKERKKGGWPNNEIFDHFQHFT
jgi:hypothetical protein